MTLNDLITSVNTYIGDSSTDRVSSTDRYGALTEATAWLLEELGNEHMTDRSEIEFLPTVMWYKMDNLTPYLLTAGQLRFKEEAQDREDFTRVEPRDLASMEHNRCAYAIERFNGDSYLGIILPTWHTQEYTDLIAMNADDGLTYTGSNTANIVEEANAIRFDMANTGQTSTYIGTTTSAIDISDYAGTGVLILEVEIPDITDVTSVSLRFGSNLTTTYYQGTVAQDVGNNALVNGVNILKFKLSDLTVVGSPSLASITEWRFIINHSSGKAVTENFRFSDLRIANPIYLNFKYIFYRVGKDTNGVDITEFTAATDVPFFAERYPQYKFAVAHKAAGVIFRSLQLIPNARSEDAEANRALDRYRKNFSGERDMASSAFKLAGVNLRGRRIIRRR